jgi:hypothetical protein
MSTTFSLLAISVLLDSYIGEAFGGSAVSAFASFEHNLINALGSNVPLADQVHRSKQRAYWAALPSSTILGSRIVKVEPRPGSLSTVMSPPII